MTQQFFHGLSHSGDESDLILQFLFGDDGRCLRRVAGIDVGIGGILIGKLAESSAVQTSDYGDEFQGKVYRRRHAASGKSPP